MMLLFFGVKGNFKQEGMSGERRKMVYLDGEGILSGALSLPADNKEKKDKSSLMCLIFFF